jgi:phosphotriesterase-related protein
MSIYTVLGPIAAEELGPTNMHEHVFLDARTWLTPPREPLPENSNVTMENIGFLRWNPMALEDNLVIDDKQLAIEEVSSLKAVGGSGLVDLTCIGIGPRIEDLVTVSEATGLHIMAGCGFYVHPTHPEWVERASAEELTEFLLSELTNGIQPTNIRPALIGEIGTSGPITERERKVLIAAGRAGSQTGAAVNDLFGSEQYFLDGWKDPTDDERMQYVRLLVDEGYAGQLVLGSDIWVKTSLRHYGGMGYDHVQKRIVPALERVYGVDRAALDRMLVETPRRLLDRP